MRLVSFTRNGTASFGILLVAGGLHGYFLTATNWWQRAGLIVGGLLLIDPGIITDIIGALIAGTVLATQWLERRRVAERAAVRT